jgi:hypothetical protein
VELSYGWGDSGSAENVKVIVPDGGEEGLGGRGRLEDRVLRCSENGGLEKSKPLLRKGQVLD